MATGGQGGFGPQTAPRTPAGPRPGEVARAITVSQLEQVFDAGFRAVSVPTAECPYPEASWERSAWLMGRAMNTERMEAAMRWSAVERILSLTLGGNLPRFARGTPPEPEPPPAAAAEPPASPPA